MYRYLVKVKTGFVAETTEYTSYASSSRVAINKTLEGHWKEIAYKDLPPGDGMLFTIDIENQGTVVLTGRFTWRHEEQRGRAGFAKWATEKGWRTSQEIPDGHEVLNRKNNHGYSLWFLRDGFAGSNMVDVLDNKIAHEEDQKYAEEEEEQRW